MISPALLACLHESLPGDSQPECGWNVFTPSLIKLLWKYLLHPHTPLAPCSFHQPSIHSRNALFGFILNVGEICLRVSCWIWICLTLQLNDLGFRWDPAYDTAHNSMLHLIAVCFSHWNVFFFFLFFFQNWFKFQWGVWILDFPFGEF